MNLTIRRPKQWADFFRKYSIWADDECLGQIKRGRELDVLVPRVAKVLYAKIDWCRSNEIDISTLKTGQVLEVSNTGASRGRPIPLTRSEMLDRITDERDSYLMLRVVGE